MANIKKSFNFRNGVQVDDDNLVVSATGLIGIGTTVPTQALDIRGDFVCSGLTSSIFGKVGFLTVTTLEPEKIIGAGVSIKAGIVTGQAGDIVTYFGDGSNLINLPTSQWEDTNAGFAVSSIYNRGSTVGIATTNPQFTLQIGNNPNVGESGVGIASAGNINASGTITASTFVGNVTGNVTGEVTGSTTGAINITSGISTFNDVKVLGIITASSGQNKIPALYATLADLPSATEYHGMFAHVHATGKGYYSHAGAWFELVNKDVNGNVVLNGNLDVDGHTELDNVNISGISTLGVTTMSTGSNFSFGNHATFKDEKFLFMGDDGALIIGHHAGPGHSQIKHDSAAQDLVLSADRVRIINRAENKGLASLTEGGAVVLKYDGNDKFQTTQEGAKVTGILSTTDNITSLGKLGIGTINTENTVHIRQAGSAELQITSDSSVAGLTVGREPGTANTNNAEFRYGESGGTDYNTAQSLDIINYGTDNFNYYLSANNAGAVAGNFFWHKGLNNSTLMTLKNTGRLGIGVTEPTKKLDVLGNAQISSDLSVGGDLSVTGSLNSNITGNLTGNVNATTGTSNFNFINFNKDNYHEFGQIETLAIGIGTTSGGKSLSINDAKTDKFFVTTSGKVGIKTDDLHGHALYVNGAIVSNTSLCVGQDGNSPTAAVDFKNAGKDGTGSSANRMYMYPPVVDGNSSLTGMSGGALFFNSTSSKLEVYDGSNWVPLEANSGGGEVNQNAFSNIAVSGQGTIQADAKLDTLNLAAGSNITITTNIGNDTVTIASNPGAVNVKDYGAKGNYNTQTSTGDDDRQAIINAIAALGTEGGTVYFPPGNYYVSNTIEINGDSGGDVVSNCVIFEGLSSPADGGFNDAGGAEICVKKNDNHHIFYINGAEAVHFRNLRFRGGDKHGSGGTGSNTTAHALIFERQDFGGNDHLLENLVFVGMAACVRLLGASRTTLRKVRIGHCPNASVSIIAIEESDYETGSNIHKNRIDQTRLEGVVIDAAPDSTNDSSRNSGANGLGMFGFCNTVFVKDSSFIRCNYGVLFDSTLDPAAGDPDNHEGEFFYFQNTEVERARLDGWSIAGGEFISLDNCFASSCDQNGIKIINTTSTSVNITNPNVRDNAGHGILIDSTTLNNCSIVNPSIGGNSRGTSGNHGIVIGSNVNNVYIAGGKIGGDIKLSSSATTQSRGILIDGATHSNIRIIGTNVLNNVNADGIGAAISSGTGNSIKFNAGSTVDIDT